MAAQEQIKASRPTAYDLRPTVVVVGGASVDIVGMTAGPVQPRVSNPGRVRISPGGAGRNVAENLARLGLRVALMTAVDAGPLGDWLIERTSNAGVDVTQIVRVEGRGHYYVAIESAGVLQWATSDMAAAESVTPGAIDARAGLIRAAEAVILDANMLPATIRRVAELAAGRLCLLPVSVAKSRRVLDVLNQSSMIALTAAEAQTLTDRPVTSRDEIVHAGRHLQSRGPAAVVITAGDQGMVWIGKEAAWAQISPEAVVDATGAGDAVAAVSMFCMLAGVREDLAARLAAAAGALTCGIEGATHPGLTREALHRYAELAENI